MLPDHPVKVETTTAAVSAAETTRNANVVSPLDMLHDIESRAWLFVHDNYNVLPDVYDIAPADWTSILPLNDRAWLATTMVHKEYILSLWEDAIGLHGVHSPEAEHAAEQTFLAEQILGATIERAVSTAEQMMCVTVGELSAQ